MPLPLELLSKVAPIAARHFEAYLELFADEASELGVSLTKRMALAIVAFLSTGFAVAMGCVWILNAVWDTTWRQFGIVSLFVVFTVGAIVAVAVVLRRSAIQTPFHRLRSEWSQDHQMILEFMEEKNSQYSTESRQNKTQQYKTATSQEV